MNKCSGCEKEERNENSFAMELLKAYSAQAKRWFIIAVIELLIILSAVGGVIYFITTSEITYTEISTEDGGNANYVEGSTVGDINNGEN